MDGFLLFDWPTSFFTRQEPAFPAESSDAAARKPFGLQGVPEHRLPHSVCGIRAEHAYSVLYRMETAVAYANQT